MSPWCKLRPTGSGQELTGNSMSASASWTWRSSSSLHSTMSWNGRRGCLILLQEWKGDGLPGRVQVGGGGMVLCKVGPGPCVYQVNQAVCAWEWSSPQGRRSRTKGQPTWTPVTSHTLSLTWRWFRGCRPAWGQQSWASRQPSRFRKLAISSNPYYYIPFYTWL